jgi:hypothetical protein
MNGKILAKLFVSAIISAGAAVGLQIAGLSPFIIILGFRFHICLVIPGLFFLSDSIETVFRSTRYSWGRHVGLFILLLFVAGIPFALLAPGIATFQKNDNFYELGVSSVIDLPLYFIWNLPQLIMLYYVLKKTTQLKASFIYVLLFLIIITAPAFIPLGTPVPIYSIAGALLVIFMAAMLTYKAANWIEFTLFLFFIIWSGVLIFGTQNEILVKLFLGKNYESWDGFIEVKGFLTEIIRTAYLAILFLVVAMIRKPKKSLKNLKNA